ncbi:VCBS repeat-containing protein [Thalassobius sp. Cn5-15]|uniref:FG-GAP repeat domain-containing protein n=1 Tax=Thalassobius sp. Cn5-15 TaxID=2917763 RepID=UPI001EF2664D|nr:VCBS repeat-containing protein [Thalassobius sp. Cn5-15]MCG7494329.1 VCBS repeat-containing protein [Thalassobius sp. Cn5-15]
MLRAGLFVALVCLSGTVAAADPLILSARFDEPTTRYPHGVLGDAVEYGQLVLEVAEGDTRQRVTITLPQDHVFEDLAPRLVDVTGNGVPEVVVIETDAARGAALAIYNADGKLAETPHIGTTNRWLAPIGAADLDGDGYVELAYIDRPHLAKTLRVWRYADGNLIQIASTKGLTNHKIGWDFIAGGLLACDDMPELITADAGWSRIVATRLEGDQLMRRDLGAYDGPKSLDRATLCE